jgi:hypothetical protein
MFKITLRQLSFALTLSLCFYVLNQFAAAYFYVWEFQDSVVDEVKFAPMRDQMDEGRIFLHIRDAARYYNLEMDPSEIKVSKRATIPGMTWTTLGVDLTYTALVDLSLFKHTLHFHTTASAVY